MHRLPSTATSWHVEREAYRIEKLRSDPSKLEVALIWERPVFRGQSALLNWVPFYVRVSTTGAASFELSNSVI